MKNITKILALILAAAMSCALMTSCGRSRLDTEGLSGGEPLVSESGDVLEDAQEAIEEDDEDEDEKKNDKEEKSKKSGKKASAKKYNKDYINVTGKTIGDIAKEQGMDFDEFLATNGYPADMHEDTYETAAYYSRNVERVAQDAGATLEELQMIFGLDKIDPDATWGEVYDTIKLRNIVGEDGLDAFKKQFDLGDDVTLDTKWGEIRNIVDKHEKESRENAGMAQ